MSARLAIAALLLTSAAPESFEAQTPPAAPDYAKASSWAALGNAPGASATLPGGATPVTRKPAADVFYINPTTYRSDSRWNQDIADSTANAWTDGSVVARQASVFSACCRVFAPRYRQASSHAFRNMASGGEAAFALAYADVERAFDRYIAHDNHGRPFFIAGHSQGARHTMALLERRIDGTPLSKHMVAAYVVGVDLVEGDFGRTFPNLTACRTPAQTGCVVAWNAMLPGADLDRLGAMTAGRFVARFGGAGDRTPVCLNPLTFDAAKPAATADAAQGAIPGDPDATAPQPLVAHAVAAHCEKGYLIVEPKPELGLKPLPGGSMHYHDYGLFWADLRADAARRVAAFRSTRH